MKTLARTVQVDYTTPVVSLALAKANANIFYTDQDDLLTLFLQASIEDAEEYTGTKIQERTAYIMVSEWAQFIDLPVAPLTTITSIVYKDEDGTEQTLTAGDDYETVRDGYGLYFKQPEFPVLQANVDFPITITGKVGYTEATVPTTIQSAILLKFGHRELYREDAPKTGNDRSFFAALRPFKIWGNADSI